MYNNKIHIRPEFDTRINKTSLTKTSTDKVYTDTSDNESSVSDDSTLISEPAKTEPAKTEPAKTEPAKTEPTNYINIFKPKYNLGIKTRYILFYHEDEIIYGDTWMAQLNDLVIKKSNYKPHLYDLALVGTNESMSYGIHGFSSWTADNNKMNLTNKILNIASWTGVNYYFSSSLKKQTHSLIDQFMMGCRVFDLKIVESNGKYYGTNEMISCNFISELIRLRHIIKNEIVIFIFRKLYCDPVEFFDMLDYVFESNIIDNINDLNIHNLIAKNKNILLFVEEYIPKLNQKMSNKIKNYYIYSTDRFNKHKFSMSNLFDLCIDIQNYINNFKNRSNNPFYKLNKYKFNYLTFEDNTEHNEIKNNYIIYSFSKLNLPLTNHIYMFNMINYDSTLKKIIYENFIRK